MATTYTVYKLCDSSGVRYVDILDGGEGFCGLHSIETKLKLANSAKKKAVKCSNGLQFVSVREAARVTGTIPGHIVKCCNGFRSTAGGYSWNYIVTE